MLEQGGLADKAELRSGVALTVGDLWLWVVASGEDMPTSSQVVELSDIQRSRLPRIVGAQVTTLSDRVPIEDVATAFHQTQIHLRTCKLNASAAKYDLRGP